MSFYKGRHILSGSDFDYHLLENIFKLAEVIEAMEMDRHGREELSCVLNPIDRKTGRRLGEQKKVLIYSPNAPSLRTAVGSEVAVQLLGGQVNRFQGMFSPFTTEVVGPKGESLLSVVRTAIAFGYDMIIVRNDNIRAETDSFHVLVDKIETLQLKRPFFFLSAGEGYLHHPLQMLTDLSVLREFKREQLMSGSLRLGLVGDVERSRVFRSLVPAMAYYGGTIYSIAPEGMLFPEDVWEEAVRINNEMMLLRSGTESRYRDPIAICTEGRQKLRRVDIRDPFEVASEVDAWIFARLQKNLRADDSPDYLAGIEAQYPRYCMRPELAQAIRNDAIITHSLPDAGQFPEKYHLGEDPRFVQWRGVEKSKYTKAAVIAENCAPNNALIVHWNRARNVSEREKMQETYRQPQDHVCPAD